MREQCPELHYKIAIEKIMLYNLTFTSAEQCLKFLITMLPRAYVLPISLFIYSSS